PGGFPGPGSRDRLIDDPLRYGRVFLQIIEKAVREDGLRHGPRFAVPQLGLGLPFKLRIGNLDADDRRQALPDIVTGQVAVAVLQQIRSEEHTSELQSRENLVCRLLLEKKKQKKQTEIN